MIPELGNAELRVLALTPTGKDAELVRSMLDRADVASMICPDLDDLQEQLDEGVGAVLIPEEFVLKDQNRGLSSWLRAQPPWSDLPVLVLARPGANSVTVARAMNLLGNVTVLERPTRVAALVSAIRTALRARERQYQIRDYIEAHEKSDEQLREADRRKDEFLAILAHELRNPLAPIRSSLDILRLTSGGDANTRQVGEMMERQVNQMVRLVDDLMEVSRITRGKIELRTERISLGSVLHDAIETSRPFIEGARHELVVDIPTDPIAVDADPVRLAQVFANLLNNAAKYTDAGGTIWLTAGRDGDRAVVSVRDTGCGIPAEMVPHVFELFTQADATAGRTKSGLGIGLTLVKRLAEMHGAAVQVHSEGLGKGSEFVVHLPLATGFAALGTIGIEALEARPLLRRILVVDDNRDAAVTLGIVLKLMGAEVQVVHSGAAALEALLTYRPDVVLLDISMPDMDGYEVARRIRQHPEFRHLTLVALTGRGQQEDRRLSALAGFDSHVVKPVDIDVLEAILASLEQRPERRAAGE